MDKLAQELEATREQLVADWDEERAARLFAGVGQLKRRRTAARVGLATVTAAAGAVALLLMNPGAAPETQLTAEARPGATHEATAGETVRAGQLRLADGSTASMVGEGSELELLKNTPSHIAMRLHQGQARFDVVPSTGRSFAVETGPYRVVVLGTVFEVTRGADEVVVYVERGKVRVYGPAGAYDVAAGERQAFLLEPAAVEAEEVEEAAVETKRVKRRARGKRAAKSWRSLSQSGDYDGAFKSLQAGGVVDNEPSALMDAADAARLSGHPRSAVKYLERVVRDHGKSPVAPLAAFTLGRVYLDRLGHPQKAAQAFARSRALAPSGAMAQDALAREVEALSKGGDAAGAYKRAQQYLRRYPKGRRVRAVQLYGGID